MAGHLVGGSYLSAILQVSFDSVTTPEFMDFVRRHQINLDEVENLKRISAMIQTLTDEAEVKQFTNPSVKLWLEHLRQFVYDADDILDEYVTEILRLKMQFESQIYRDQQVGKPFSHPPTTESIFSSLSSGHPEEAVSIVFDGYHRKSKTEVKDESESEVEYYDIHEGLRKIEDYGKKVKEINEILFGVAQSGFDIKMGLSGKARPSMPRLFNQRPPTSSLVNKDSIFGREEDKEKIISFLLIDKPTLGDNSFSVLPIVGMGGLGKTTLAQLIYGDEGVMDHFSLKAWVCVGEEFDIVKITRDILESITRRKPETDLLDQLQNQLQTILSKKKFLLVLDDVWNLNYNKWDSLQTPFAAGAPGSKILVTTRDNRVSLIMGNVTAHRLERLSDDACKLLLRRHALLDENSLDAVRRLEKFGGEVAEKCSGVPLAVKTIAGLLRNKTEDSEWKAVLENEIWDFNEDESEILPSLMLSYHHLPPHLKRCFAYCALFPKDYEFKKVELVRLWMAEGIVQPKGKKRLEDIGAGYFEDLFTRSFFELSSSQLPFGHQYKSLLMWTDYDAFSSIDAQHDYDTYSQHERKGDKGLFDDLSRCLAIKSFSESSNNISGSSKFVMHDLIHDLAKFVSGEINFRTEGDRPPEIPTKTRHLSYDIVLPAVTNFKEIKEMKSLRTLLKYTEVQELLRKKFCPVTHQFLRVLCLAGCSNHYLPDSISKLKHLRLLDLSSSNIARLPNSFGRLYNLQTLVLSGCWNLKELPKDMSGLVNLRHLFLPEVTASPCELPIGVGNLTGLQTLSTFIVGSENSSVLRNLSQLRGTLDISKLENVGNIGSRAIVANLKNKPHLLGLKLSWSDYRKNKSSIQDLGRDEKVEEDVLYQLQPHTNLEMLSIANYGGTRFPNWVGHPSFCNLMAVKLSGCYNCKVLPSLWRLPLLKHLMIDSCSAPTFTGSELCGANSLVNKQFQSLETLVIHHMTEWKEWSEVVEEQGREEFPCLHKLTIRYCPKLSRFSHGFSSLVTLIIGECEELKELPWLLPSLQHLRIEKCKKLAVLPSLPSIQRLALDTCHQMTTLSDLCNSNGEEDGEREFHGLHELYIFHCCSMRKLPHTFPSLMKLRIKACKEVSFLPMLPSIKQLRLEQCNERVLEKVSDLSSLSSLYMEGILGVSSLPHVFFQHLTALQQLEIHSFSELMMNELQHFPSLRHLVIAKCHKLLSSLDNAVEEGEGLLVPSCLEYLKLSKCDSLKKLPQNLCNLHFLKELIIEEIRGFTCLPEGLHKLMSLQELHILSCPSLVSLEEITLPIRLQYLIIGDCRSLKSLPKGLHKLTSLHGLQIEECPALKSFPDMGLPTTLLELLIIKCGKLNSLPKEVHKLSKLKQLEIMECSFLMKCKNLQSLGLHNFTSLTDLVIGGCPALLSIPEGLLPTNLRKFSLKNCPILKSLDDRLSHLTFLEGLYIENCPQLKQWFQKEEGKEWSKIAQIL